MAPVAAVAIGAAVQRRPWMMVVVAILCTVRGARFAADDVARFRTIIADLATVRGVDVALEEAAPGDTVWLVTLQSGATTPTSPSGHAHGHRHGHGLAVLHLVRAARYRPHLRLIRLVQLIRLARLIYGGAPVVVGQT